jgi:hypothetical protein
MGKIKNSAVCVSPSHKIIMLNLHALLEILVCMNGLLGGVNPDLGRLCVSVDCLFPYHMSAAGWEPSPRSPLAGMVAYLNWVLSIVPLVPRVAVTWTCGQLDWFSLIMITFIDTNSPSPEPPRERKYFEPINYIIIASQ